MTDISVIILVGREERHIRRCLEKLAPLAPRQVFIVESQKGDRTHEIAVETAKCLNWRVEECLNGGDGKVGVENRGTEEANQQAGRRGRRPLPCEINNSAVHLFSTPIFFSVWHDWPGNQSAQFNWALDNLPIEGAWVLRLDADEYLTEESIEKLRGALIERALPAGANPARPESAPYRVEANHVRANRVEANHVGANPARPESAPYRRGWRD